MNELQSVLNFSKVYRLSGIANKKKLFERLAEYLSIDSELTFARILDGLNSREKLGSTYVGKGVAIPHCKLSVSEVKVVILILDEKIKYSDDKQQVDILFGLLVPSENCDQHLKLLSSIARLCEKESWLAGLRALKSEADITQYFANTETALSHLE